MPGATVCSKPKTDVLHHLLGDIPYDAFLWPALLQVSSAKTLMGFVFGSFTGNHVSPDINNRS